MIKKVTAIFDELKLDSVEKALLRHGVKGLTVHKVRGRGEYFNSYGSDPLTAHILVEIYTTDRHAKRVAQVIMEAAHSNVEAEGLVSIDPINEFYWIHTKARCSEEDFGFQEVDHG